jgi:lysine 2,3-aminomutase
MATDTSRGSYVSVAQLQQAGLLTAAEAPRLQALEKRFKVRVPHYYAALFDRTNLQGCPLRLQALPALGEHDPPLPPWATRISQAAFNCAVPWRNDAIGDVAHLAAPRLTHRYTHRAIVHLSAVCALYCRFCFRKSHLNEAERPLYRGDLQPAYAYLGAHPQIREVILTGGDPLAISNRRLREVFAALQSIAHIKTVRLHSRMAATAPHRLNAELASLCAAQPFAVVLVSHFNHPKELTAQAVGALRRLQRHGVQLYNQSVLLRRINDTAETLFELFQGLYEAGVTPYYLHHPDWTPGTFHFRLPIARGQELVEGLAGKLCGPALPRYVLDLPGGAGKLQLTGRGVQCLETQQDARMGGALYRMHPPHTRSGETAPTLYADLWPR